MSDTLSNDMRELVNGTGGPAAVELPPDRAKGVEYGLVQFQQVGPQRDELRKEKTNLRDPLAAARIENKGLNSPMTEALSHIKYMMQVRDEALAHRVKYEALFISIQAQLRAFAVPVEPLIRERDE